MRVPAYGTWSESFGSAGAAALGVALGVEGAVWCAGVVRYWVWG